MSKFTLVLQFIFKFVLNKKELIGNINFKAKFEYDGYTLKINT